MTPLYILMDYWTAHFKNEIYRQNR